MSNRHFIYKPIEVTQDKRLTAVEKDYLCLIAQLQNAGGCTAGNKWFAEYFGVKRTSAVEMIGKLKQKGFIGSKVERQGAKVKTRTLFLTDSDSRERLPMDSRQSLPGIVGRADFDSRQNPPEKTKAKTKNKTKRGLSRFTPPTLQEIELYVKEKNLNVNCKKFLDYYTESGWEDKDGNPVQNWKLKIIGVWSDGPRNEKTQRGSSPNRQRPQKNRSFAGLQSAVGQSIEVGVEV